MEPLFVKFTENGGGSSRAQAERAPGLLCGAHFEFRELSVFDEGEGERAAEVS